MADTQSRRRPGTKTLWTLLLLWLIPVTSLAIGGQPEPIVILLGIGADGTVTISGLPPQWAGLFVPQKGAGQLPQLPPPPPPPQQAGVVDVFTALNVRTGPGTQYAILGTLGPGQPVQIVGESNGWCQVMWHGRVAWISGHYVWHPGKSFHNPGIQGAASRVFPGKTPGQPPPRPSPPPPPRPPSNNPPPSGAPHLADGGLKMPIYNQNNIGAMYPSGFCGPTSLKMVLGYYGIDKNINYLGLTDVGGATPVYNKGVGAGHQAMLDMLQHCGLKGSYMTHGKSIDWLRQQTAAGYPVVTSVAGDYGAGFHTDGHIVVVSGVTPDGRVILSDSAGGKHRVVSGSQFLGAWSASSRMAIVAKT